MSFSENPDIQSQCPVLAEAAGVLGYPEIRRRATIGGNVANASPAGDLSTALLSLDASVVVRSLDGGREVALAGFFSGPGRTVLGRARPLPPSGCRPTPGGSVASTGSSACVGLWRSGSSVYPFWPSARPRNARDRFVLPLALWLPLPSERRLQRRSFTAGRSRLSLAQGRTVGSRRGKACHRCPRQ